MLSLLLNYRLICHVIPPEQVSIYVVALGIVGLGSLICGSGLGSVLLRRMSWTRQSNVEPSHRTLMIRVLALATGGWLIVPAGLLAILTLYPDFFRRPILPIAWLSIVWIAARCFLSLVTEAIRGLQRLSLQPSLRMSWRHQLRRVQFQCAAIKSEAYCLRAWWCWFHKCRSLVWLNLIRS